MVAKKNTKSVAAVPVIKSFTGKLTGNFRYQALLIFLLTFIFYGNTIKNDYSLDDIYVTNNQVIKKGFKAIPAIFRTTYASVYEDGEQMNFGYRPIVRATFAIEAQFFGLNPHVSHFINILLYALTCLLLFVILRKLLYEYHPVLPLLITILFLAHPVHTEVVSSLKNRDELLCFLLGLLTLLFMLRFTESGRFYFFLIALGCFFLGRLSKPTIISFIVLVPFLLFFFRNITLKKTAVIFFSMLGIFLLAKIFTIAITPANSFRPKLFVENPLIYTHSFWLKISTSMIILSHYLKLVLFPHPLLYYYGYNMIPVTGWNQPFVYLSLVIHIGLIYLTVWSFKKNRIISAGIWIYLAGIFQYSNIVQPPLGMVADRFLYAPSLGFSFIAAYLIFVVSRQPVLAKVPEDRKLNLMTGILLLILIPYGIKTITRNHAWKDQLSLLKSDMPYLEQSAKAHYIYAGTLKNKAIELHNEGESENMVMEYMKEAVYHAQKATAVFKDYYQAYNLTGTIYANVYKNYDSALKYFSLAAKSNAFYAPAWFNLGFIYKEKNDTAAAIAAYKKSILINPGFHRSYAELSEIYRKSGNLEMAKYYFEQAGTTHPSSKRHKTGPLIRLFKKMAKDEIPEFN